MLRRTSLFEEHRALGGRLVDFGGWELPIQYSGVLSEHVACRSSAGLFDVSHMGEIHVEGSDAEAYLNYLVTNCVTRLAVGQAQYTVMCHESGGMVDDLVIYRRGPSRFLLVVNASNTDKDWNHLISIQKKYQEKIIARALDLQLSNESSNYTQIAIQGPKAAQILEQLNLGCSLEPIKNYWFVESTLLGTLPAIIARTGYTGEDGFEIYVSWEKGPVVWKALTAVGAPLGLTPCGLGARDTLRLEMKYPLYGHELNDETNPWEAGLGWVVKLDAGDFIGRESLVKAKEKGLSRKLVGFKLIDRGIARQGYPLCDSEGQQSIGEVTSGTQSPSLKESIGVGYVSTAYASIGSKISVKIRGTSVLAEVVATPFYKRPD